ncbi:MAG TPA: FadR/GntR family transcriptional regulator [Arachidicoccus soli]|nr:FadR/GntR family transcriptional regulator [Arachidicoccus soli]HEU0227711.1 FadR/GntR family transcriptional regulator [Arachidicoccus soli]
MKNTNNQASDLSTMLDIVDTSSLADKVEIILIKFFLDNNLKPGDAIPKEINLAESLGVSRTVIREALLRLRMTGLIESKKKRGAVLANPDLISLLQKTLYPTMMDENTLRDMFEMRLVMEIGMADLIFLRITPEDIKELTEIVKVEPAKADTFLFDIEQEIKFHGKLYEITGNNTLKRFQQMLLPVFKYVHESGILAKKIKGKRFVSHKGIVDIIKKGTPDDLRNAMRSHFENHFQRLF